MHLTKLLLSASLGLAIVGFAGAASATPIPVTNPSFETLPAGGLPFGGCGPGCSYSTDADIPGWIASGFTGEFQPGVGAGNTTYFNSIPDGKTVAYTSNGLIYQQVLSSIEAGTNYQLDIDFGFRKDITNGGLAWLQVDTGSHNAYATGTALQLSGDWSTYTAFLKPIAADAGKSLYVVMNDANGGQADFDNVRVAAVRSPVA